MSHTLSTKDIVTLGWCNRCKQYVEGLSNFSGLPNHKNQEGEHCPNSGYSATEIKYKIDSPEAALLLAKIIADDTQTCLGSFYGGQFHSINCGDGRNCAEERNRRANALAQYIIDTLTV